MIRKGASSNRMDNCFHLSIASPTLEGSTQTEDKYIPYSAGKTLAQIKKEQNWFYDPTIKYESLRQCTVPRFAYCDDSATDWSDSSASSDSEIEPVIMTVEEAQTRKDKILAEARKEKPFPDHPRVSYQVLKQFEYVDPEFVNMYQ
ncbi:hypothetical protein POM88_020191 [Heracleum sosnowskyi]|uniref:Uncharacterized protein n=1 Tax=Heracleum sosnowskyi TaxID=360622 RepID=A0AAD8MR83_9APIA|nr:hypothetical protein POM88_020191 [Heracleum sosnowskyi]